MSFDLSESKLLEIMSDSKTIRIILLICINGSLNESEILKLSGFTNEEVIQRLFEMLKYSLIESSLSKINGVNKTAYSMASHSILLLGIMACAYLFEPESRIGKLNIAGQRSTNPDRQHKYFK